MTRGLTALAALLVLSTVAACEIAPPGPAVPRSDELPVPAAVSTPTAAAAAGPRPIPADDTAPVRVRIPAISVDSMLEVLDRDGSGRLAAPVDWQRAGWYAGGPVPGDRGPAVIAGHVDSPDGPAVFAELAELRRGDRVVVQLSDGETAVFEVDGSRTVPQAQFPTAAVYGPVPDRQLRLITCHTYEAARGQYVDNLVVFATAVV